MSKVGCIIVEDEPLAAKILVEYIEHVTFLKLKGVFKDAILATDYLRENEIDLIFLDIHLPKVKGLAFLKMLTSPPAVIVTTAYHQYAVDGFTLNVTDYLLKPIEFERFLAAVNKVPRTLDRTGAKNNVSSRDHLFLSVQKKKVKILFSDIHYVESQREYVKIVTSKGEYVSKISTHEIAALLPSDHFKRIHRSFIVSTRKIDSYTADEVEIDGIAIPVGRDYKKVLEDL